MADDTILVTETGQTFLQAYTGTVSGKIVKSEAMTPVDSNNTPFGTLANPFQTSDTNVNNRNIQETLLLLAQTQYINSLSYGQGPQKGEELR